MKLERLRGRKISETVLRKGKMWKGKTLAMHWIPGAPRRADVNPEKAAVYVGTVASAKLSKSAVERNRMRRRCREALRVALKAHEKLPTVQLLIRPLFASLHCDFSLIEKDIESFLSHLTHAPR